MKVHFAPLQGYADWVYLKHHKRIYGGADAVYTPFIRVEKGEPRRQDMARLQKALSNGLEIVPQVIFGSVEEFTLLVEALRELGSRRIDLNLGCPYPMQTGKERGSAMIANVGVMERVAELIEGDSEVAYSVKMRLGFRDADEWKKLLPLLNNIQLSHLTVHPRVASQMYGGAVDMEAFGEIVRASGNPVVYNGDLQTPADINRIAAAYPEIAGVMVGRGFLARPSFGVEWSENEEWDKDRRMAALRLFHQSVFDEYAATLCGDTQTLQKIKSFWDYLEPEIGRKTFKEIKKSTSIAKYMEVVGKIGG